MAEGNGKRCHDGDADPKPRSGPPTRHQVVTTKRRSGPALLSHGQQAPATGGTPPCATGRREMMKQRGRPAATFPRDHAGFAGVPSGGGEAGKEWGGAAGSAVRVSPVRQRRRAGDGHLTWSLVRLEEYV